MMRQALTNFLQLCRKHKGFLVLSCLCLVCAFVSFLFLQEKGYYAYTVSTELTQETQTLYIASDDPQTLKTIYSQLKSDAALPRMGIATLSDATYAGVSWDREWQPDVWYTPYGRFFSTEEMETGAPVVLLGMEYLRQLSKEQLGSIWDMGIVIHNTPLRAIGNYHDWDVSFDEESRYETSSLPTSLTLTLQRYLQLGLAPTQLRVVFSTPLSGEQRAHLSGLLQPYDSLTKLSLPKEGSTSAVSSYISATAQYALILAVSLLSIVSVLVYWLRAELARYTIYRICGARRWQIVFFLSMNVWFLVTGSYACACLLIYGITKLTPAGLVSLLPLADYVVIYLGALAFSLITVNIRALPVVLGNEILQK